jgi:hypothetical protein
MASNIEYRVGEVGPSGSTIKEIIIQGIDFIVYIDEGDNIQWSTEETYTDFHPQFGSIQNRVSYWESVSNKLFSTYDAYDFKCLLAEAYARIIDEKNLELSNDIIALTVNRIEKSGREILKQEYIISSFVCTSVVMALIVAVIFSKHYLIAILNRDAFQILLTSLFGGVGAFVFATLRLRNYSPELAISKHIHRVDGALRVFYGIISGLIIGVGIKSDVLLGFISKVPSTIYLEVFLGIIAGASEVIIPNLIKQVEGKVNEKTVAREVNPRKSS